MTPAEQVARDNADRERWLRSMDRYERANRPSARAARGILLSVTVGAVVWGLLAFGLAGCAAIQTAKTPEQRFYAAVGTYNVVADAFIAADREVHFDEATLDKVAAIDDRAQTAIEAARVVLAQPDSPERDRTLAVVQLALDAAIAELRDYVARGSVPR